MNKKLFKEGISKDVMLVFYSINKKCRKVILTVMAILMIAGSVLPRNYQTIYAAESSNDEPKISSHETSDYATTTDENFDITAIKVEEEIEALRTINTKTFRRSDGTYELAIYGQPIHYEQNGQFNDIDNTLSFDSENECYQNKANTFNFKLPKTIDQNKSFMLTMKDYSINWSVKTENTTNMIASSEKQSTDTIKSLTKINQSVVYEDIISNVDLEYILMGNKIKENLILNRYVENFKIGFTYSLNHLELTVNELGSYVFVNDDGEIVFKFEDFYMYDAKNEMSTNIKLEVIETKNSEYQITIVPDDTWLKSASYPVIIDPTLTSPTEISIKDTYIDPNNNYARSSTIMMDNGSFNIGYINFYSA